MENRDFKGVWIPKEIYLNKELSWSEKILLIEINSLDNNEEKGCFASNKYLSEFIGISESSMANMVSKLKAQNYIFQVFFDGRNRGLRVHKNMNSDFTGSQEHESRLHKNMNPDLTFLGSQTTQKNEHSNTINNTGNNTDKKQIMTFEEFWSLYPKKVGRVACEPKFNKLPDSDKQKIKDTLKDWTNHKPFATYNHPNPVTYISQQRWNDEIPTVPVKKDPLAPRPSSNPINPYDAFR
jgi:hypothetical protein